MSDFATCFAFVLENEAGSPPNYAIVPDPTKTDPAAKACSGINSSDFPETFDMLFQATPAERPSIVAAFYEITYFNRWLCQLPNEIAMRVMDAEVNEGAGVGVKLLQQACNRAIGAPIVVTDGLWGPATVQAVNDQDAASLIAFFKAARVDRYKAIATANPAEAVNLRGWIARAEK